MKRLEALITRAVLAALKEHRASAALTPAEVADLQEAVRSGIAQGAAMGRSGLGSA